MFKDLRNLRFAYKKQEQSKLEIFEVLSKNAFPLSDDLVRFRTTISNQRMALFYQCFHKSFYFSLVAMDKSICQMLYM